MLNHMNDRRRQKHLKLTKENTEKASYKPSTANVIKESPRMGKRPLTEDKDNRISDMNEKRCQLNRGLNKEKPEIAGSALKRNPCDICGINCMSNHDYQVHINGSRHRENAIISQQRSKSENSSRKTVSSASSKTRKACEICGTDYMTKHDYEHHMKGNRHLENVIAYKNNKRVLRSAPARNKCEICNLDFMSDHDYEAHMKGSRHRDQARLVGIKPETNTSASSTQSKQNSCEICGIGYMSNRDYQVHLGGSQHRDKTRMLGIASKTTEKKSILTKSNSCEICGLRNMSDHNFAKHMKGIAHRQAAMAQRSKPRKTVKHPPQWKGNSCDICKIDSMSDREFTNHVKGDEHLANVAARQRRRKSQLATAIATNDGDGSLSSNLSHKKWFSCVDCEISKMDKVSYMNHIQGNRHKLNSAGPSHEDFKHKIRASKPKYSCELCGIPKLDGIKPYNEHVKGRRHREALQMICERELEQLNDDESTTDKRSESGCGWAKVNSSVKAQQTFNTDDHLKEKDRKVIEERKVSNEDLAGCDQNNNDYLDVENLVDEYVNILCEDEEEDSNLNYEDDSAGYVELYEDFDNQSHQVDSNVYANHDENDLQYVENYDNFDYNDYENPSNDDYETVLDGSIEIEIVDDTQITDNFNNHIQAKPRNKARVMNKNGSCDTCKNCGCVGFKMINCTTCRSSSYCSITCQASHAHIHENECHLLKEINDLKDRLKEKNESESGAVNEDAHRINYKDCALKSMQQCLADAKSRATLSTEELSRVSKRMQFWRGSKFSHSEDVSRAESDISSLITDLEKDKIFCSDCECWVSSGQEWTLHSNSKKHMNAIVIHDELNSRDLISTTNEEIAKECCICCLDLKNDEPIFKCHQCKIKLHTTCWRVCKEKNSACPNCNKRYL
eukprot:TRINITY_DN900_c0_g1_i7.p1 TRINITY_DN900_c0_g1~~TRINITY_DN900_c0_g1_i7.p1  ORF type:complete len:1036 (+),score=271.66 TRINITY_DN900_c0_g1_i7:403-3108(+)